MQKQILFIQNNFGFLRLLFAVLVIYSHSPEMLDGDRQREFLVSFFGTMSLGDLAVDCFFMISGYLILMSYRNSSSIRSYFLKRVLRIFPGFMMAYLFCFICVIPLAKSFEFLFAHRDFWFWFKSVARMLVLETAYVEGVFNNTPLPWINGPMWTIKYEFMCYLMVPVLFYYFKGRGHLYIAMLLCLILAGYIREYFQFDFSLPQPISIALSQTLRLVSSFMMGGIFYIYREKIVFKRSYTILSIVIFLISLFFREIAHLALITFGAYLLFNFALNYKSTFFSKVGTKIDLSFGIYLYAWPIQNLIVQRNPTIEPLILTVLTIAFASVLALISWTFIEKPFMQIKHKIN